MDLLDLISNIGSNLSLFIGISFISLAEIFELFVEIICIVFQNKKQNKSSQPALNMVDFKVKKLRKRTYSL